jgi:tRNA (cmo5U34)-methyltransferase
MRNTEIERLFSGLIGEEYELLRLMHPEAAEMSQRVGNLVGSYKNKKSTGQETLKVLEIGCGTGITSLALLHSREDIYLISVDNEPTMLNQARKNLAPWIKAGQVTLLEQDVLSALSTLPSASLDSIASAYTLHNFLDDYRQKVLVEIFRVLQPGGIFVNGDRYALDDADAHTKHVQAEVERYFEALIEINRPDVLEQWIIHLFIDESPHHVMRTAMAFQAMRTAGFHPIEEHYRHGINALISGIKPETTS